MYEPPRTTTRPPPVPQRKRGFWFWSIWVSLAGMVLFPTVSRWLGRRAFRKSTEELLSQSDFPEISPDMMTANAEHALFYSIVGDVAFLLALVWFVVSITRHLGQRKNLP